LFRGTHPAANASGCSYLPREVFFLGFGLADVIFGVSAGSLGNLFADIAALLRLSG
jgi:hypothetical protein